MTAEDETRSVPRPADAPCPDAYGLPPIVLTITTGRAGSSFLYRSFRESYGDAAHVYHELLTVREAKPACFHRAFEDERLAEMAAHPPIAAVMDRFEEEARDRPVIDFGWTMSALAPLFARRFGARFRLIVLTRHPVKSAASLSIMGLYSDYPNPEDYAISPFSRGALEKAPAETWCSLTEFEKCLYRWYEITLYGLDVERLLPLTPIHSTNSESIFSSEGELAAIARFVGLDPTRVKGSNFRNESRKANLEKHPLGEDWRRYHRHEYAVRLGESLGYSFDDEELERSMGAYRLPPPWLSKLRHLSGYWVVRERLARRYHRYLRRMFQGDSRPGSPGRE